MELAVSEGWQFDRRIPIATIASLLGFLVLQTIGAVWWASRIDFRVTALELRQETADKTFSDFLKSREPIVREYAAWKGEVNATLPRVEKLLEKMDNRLERIEDNQRIEKAKP